MQLFESKHIFNYSWDYVTAANWKKYPNELSTHVVSVDILDRTIDPEKKILRTERLIGCKQSIPSWLTYIVGGQEYSYVREISEVDLVNKVLIMKSMNLTMNHLLSVKETVVYTPNSNNTTLFNQSAEITAYASFSRLTNKIEEWSIDRFMQNAKIGKLGFEGVLGKLQETWQETGEFLGKELDEVTDKLVGLVTDPIKN